MTDPPGVGDDVFQRNQARLLAVFGVKFDAWLIQAKAAFDRPTVRGHGGSLADILKGETPPIEVDENAIRQQEEVVYTLAELCRDFVMGEVLGWALLHRRHGSTINEAICAASERAAQLQAETHLRRWTVGLRAIDGDRQLSAWGGYFFGFDQPLENTSWVRDVWTAVVEEPIPDVLEAVFKPALERDEAATVVENAAIAAAARAPKNAPIPSPAREAVERFRLMVYEATGMKIKDTDIALVAGYDYLTELQRFKRNDKRLTVTGKRAVERTLALDPVAFLEQLKRRKALKKAPGKGGIM